MQRNRNVKKIKELTNGPAKLTQSLEITKEHYGLDLTKKSKIYITEGVKVEKITKSARVGIRNGKEKLWNFKFPA